MTKKFKPVSDHLRKGKRVEVRMNETDFLTITKNASLRNLTTSDFMRKAAIGRKIGDIDFESRIIERLSNTIMAIKHLHKCCLELGILPPEEDWLPVILEAREAIGMVSDSKSAIRVIPYKYDFQKD